MRLTMCTQCEAAPCRCPELEREKTERTAMADLPGDEASPAPAGRRKLDCTACKGLGRIPTRMGQPARECLDCHGRGHL